MSRFYTYLLLGSFLWAINPLQSKAQGVCDTAGSNGFIIKGGDVGCAESTGGLKIELEDKSGGSTIKYHYNYKGEDPVDLSWDTDPTAHLRSGDEPIHYTILQSSEKGGKISYSCRTMTVHPGINFSYNLCGGDGDDKIGELEIHFDEDQPPFKDYQIKYQIGNKSPKTVSNFPFNVPRQEISVPENLSVFAVNNNGDKICAQEIPLEGGQENSSRGSIDKIEMISGTEVEIKVRGSGVFDLYRYENTTTEENEIYKKRDVISVGTSVINIPDSTKSYCFYVKRHVCAGSDTDSPDVCTIPLQDIENNIDRNDLKWTKHNENIKGLEGEAEDNSRTNTTHIIYEVDGDLQSKVLTSGDNYSDINVDCKKTYCYQIETKVVDWFYNIAYESTSLSQKKCYDPAEIERSPLTDFYATVNSKAVEIHIDYQKANVLLPAGAERYILYHREDTDYGEVDSKTDQDIFTFTDKNPSEGSLCFKVGYQDHCGSYAALSEEVCSIHLHDDDVDHLYWTEETPFSPYIIQSYELQEDDPPFTVESFISGQTDYITDLSDRDQEVLYRILAIDENGNISSSNVIEVIPEFRLALPNAFSPNDDAYNNVFKFKGKTKMITDYSLEITNRWGNQVARFDDDDFLDHGWDGKVNGKLLPPDLYVYQIKATLINGEVFNHTGRLFILY